MSVGGGVDDGGMVMERRKEGIPRLKINRCGWEINERRRWFCLVGNLAAIQRTLRW